MKGKFINLIISIGIMGIVEISLIKFGVNNYLAGIIGLSIYFYLMFKVFK